MTLPLSWQALSRFVNSGPTMLGEPGVRDPEGPCEVFDGQGFDLEGNGKCMSDGHYLCVECSELSPEAPRFVEYGARGHWDRIEAFADTLAQREGRNDVSSPADIDWGPPVPPSPPCTCDGNGSTPCWDCGGQGGFHDCGDDCCPHLNPEDDTDCDTCGGSGFIRCAGCAAGDPPEDDDLCDGACGFLQPHRRGEVAT